METTHHSLLEMGFQMEGKATYTLPEMKKTGWSVYWLQHKEQFHIGQNLAPDATIHVPTVFEIESFCKLINVPLDITLCEEYEEYVSKQVNKYFGECPNPEQKKVDTWIELEPEYLPTGLVTVAIIKRNRVYKSAVVEKLEEGMHETIVGHLPGCNATFHNPTHYLKQ